MDVALRLEGIRKTFGSTTAVDHLDLVVPAGALYGVIGPNGAGKTTTIRMIMAILFPDSGQLSVLGHPSAMFGLLDLSLVFYLFVFFVISYLTVGSAMVAVGSAVNEMREAQTLMMPIVLLMMVPWMLAAPIAREPNSTFSTAMSFIPVVNTFAMLLRLTSSAPPPVWQVWLTIAIGIGSVVAAVWCAAKIFTIGLLMYGKPPDFRTLIRWIKVA